MMMTLSPQSTCGVNVGRCLPRKRRATIEASRPTTRPSASIITHFFSISAGFAVKVVMAYPWRVISERDTGDREAVRAAAVGVSYNRVLRAVNALVHFLSRKII